MLRTLSCLQKIPVYRSLLYPAFLCATLSLGGCYLQGSSCSGPLCVSVATEFGNERCTFDCQALPFCPDAESVRVNSSNALNQLRQFASPGLCDANNNQTTESTATAVSNLVVSSEILFAAADRQSRDMAANNFVSQIGSDGLGVEDRFATLNQTLGNFSQLVAGGFTNSRTLIDQWVRQPDECRKLLEPAVTQFAMACRFDSNTDFGTYWTLILATE